MDEVNQIIERDIRPRVQGDGGDLKLIAIEGNQLWIEAHNECSRCPLTQGCYKDWLEKEINTKLVLEQPYTLKIIIKKPYFWDM